MESNLEFKNVNDAIAWVATNAGVALKDATNPFHKAKYSSVDTIIALLSPLWVQAGIYPFVVPTTAMEVTGHPEEPDNSIYCKLTVTHNGSEKDLVQFFPVPLDSKTKNPQDLGKAISYARRYMLIALFNVQAKDDDDAESIAAKARSFILATTKTRILKGFEVVYKDEAEVKLEEYLKSVNAAGIDYLTETQGQSKLVDLQKAAKNNKKK